MLSGDRTRRLTRREVALWTRLTGYEPVEVRCAQDLLRFVQDCKRRVPEADENSQLLRYMFDAVAARCLDDARRCGPDW